MYFLQNFATSLPPCPSNTANIATSGGAAPPAAPPPGIAPARASEGSTMCSSSIERRQPCMADAPNL